MIERESRGEGQMFGWRRRSEGFEWREYVRTTILVRRADRQRRVEDARVAALEKVKHARDAGIDAGRAGAAFAGSQILKLLSFAGAVLLDLCVATFHASRRWLTFAMGVLSDVFGNVAGPLREALRGPIEAAREKARVLPDLARRSPIKSQHVIGVAAVLGLIYLGGPILRSADGVAVAKVTPEATPDASEISGRATAITGDLLRVGGKLVRLDGIEAPASGQPCYRPNGRRWECAIAARSGLSRIVRGKQIRCTPSGQDASGHALARCLVEGTKDIATELVRTGQVFATRSFFNSLSSEEETARNAKAGIWQGEVARPQDWRQRAWDDAKRDAPDGCPIKGIVRASNKVYALPWSAAYARAKVRTDRGERWFCSEDEAKAAGFQPSGQS
jgi:endonuclease YncB( thermonuclease family)